MGEKVTGTEVADSGVNETNSSGVDCEKKEEENDGVKEMEEDGKQSEKSKIQKMEVDSEGKEDDQTKEQEVTETAEVETKKKKGNDKETSKQVKMPRRHESKKTYTRVESNSSKKEVEEQKEIKTPWSSSANRPVRERKSVVRLVTSIERDSVKEFFIGKGSGSALKDIPNVKLKLSKRKTDDTLKLLHTILFGRRAKAAQVKSNISQFSGFVWSENEEHQKIKVKEKLDKCVKEKLVEFCDVLDLPTPKVNTRKEDIVAKLIDFLEAPHATSSELLAEKEQGQKRKRVSKSGASTPASTPSKQNSRKSRKRSKDASKEREEEEDTPGTGDELDDKEKEAEIEETTNGSPESKVSHSASKENKDESEHKSKDNTSGVKKESKKSNTKKETAGKGKRKEVSKPKKSSLVEKRISLKSASKIPKVNGGSDITSEISSKKKTEVAKKKASPPEKSAPKEKPGKKGVIAKGKTKEKKSRPSDRALKATVREILKEVDFNTATFADILKLLAERFKTDLTSRKSSVKDHGSE